MKAAVIERWESGGLVLSAETEMRAQMNVLDQMADLEFEAIAEFYEQIDTMNAAEGGEA